MIQSIFAEQSPRHPVVQALVKVNSGKAPRLAVLKKALKGKFTKWKKSEKVKVWHVSGSSYCIEKVKPKNIHMPILSQLAGVPRSAIEFL